MCVKLAKMLRTEKNGVLRFTRKRLNQIFANMELTMFVHFPAVQ